MYTIDKHPILIVPTAEEHPFIFNGKKISGKKGFTIAAALHQAGYPVHSHSLKDRERSLECGIGKCGACEMLVDGEIKRICITKIDQVKVVGEISRDFTPPISDPERVEPYKVFKTTVAIVGAGPAGLATRELLNEYGIDNIVIDSNDEIGGQFLMQTHQFFFFEKEKKFGGMRGFDIAHTLAGKSHEDIFLNSTVWDILEGKRLAIKNVRTDEIYFVDADHLVVATGAVPFMPTFENDDLPGVYTAAVVQKMMNTELTLLGKSVLTVGAGNIGYLTSYQLMQAGARVKAIIEAQDREGGFPVQANRLRRLGVPILTSHMLLKAIPNENHDGIIGAVIAKAENFKPIPGTEKVITGIDAINICTGLVSDDQLLIKGNEVFGRQCYGAGDAIRIGEGTTAVLRGKQVAYEILQEMGRHYTYDDYLNVSKEYIDSQQHPVRVIPEPYLPGAERMQQKPFVIIDCLYGFACNPCEFACPHGAITKTSTSTVPAIDFEKCIGCMECVYQCPGLAIFGYNTKKDWLFLPIEFDMEEGAEVFLTNNEGQRLGEGVITKILKKPNKTNIARIQATDVSGEALMRIRGFVLKDAFPEKIDFSPLEGDIASEAYICHCDDVTLAEILEVVGDRKYISVDEIKHTTRLGMGACRGKRCIPRLKQLIRPLGISIVGEATPRGPLSNQIGMAEVFPREHSDRYITAIHHMKLHHKKTDVFIAGGGIGGSALFRYFAEAGQKPTLVNYGRGASWRNIAGGRTAFTLPEIAEIARANNQIFKDLQGIKNVDYRAINYVSFAHDEETYKALEASRAWSDAYMVEPKDFRKEISPFMNPSLKKYNAALITKDCWQASPGKVIDLIRRIGIEKGGTMLEDCQLLDVHPDGKEVHALVKDHEGRFIEYRCAHFVNALGPDADTYAKKMGILTNLYPVKHQAFITRRMPYLGKNSIPLPMLIDRRDYKGFTAVYGQQLAETGQIIGCASPSIDSLETGKNLKVNSKEFIEIVSEIFVDWIPQLSSVGFQAVWAGYYIEPRMYVDPTAGLFVGLRGQGFMLGQYLAKLYVDGALGKEVPAYFNRLGVQGDGLLEKAFK